MDFVLALLGLVILLLAGDALVRGAVNMALRLGVPALLVSLTVVAFGTSAPELLITVQAIQKGAPALALGNVVGSNTANILLVLGVPALIAGIHCRDSTVHRDYLIMLGVSALFIAQSFWGPITWVDGAILLSMLAVVLWSQGRQALAHKRAEADEPAELVEGADPDMPWFKICVFLALGLLGLPLGADLLVDASTSIARHLGISEAVIGLTLVAVGTSLPELATSVMAALRKHADVALGNVVGSNMFNLLAIIGIGSLVGPIPVPREFLMLDLWVMLASAILLAPFIFLGKSITKRWGFGFLVLYGAYLMAVIG